MCFIELPSGLGFLRVEIPSVVVVFLYFTTSLRLKIHRIKIWETSRKEVKFFSCI
jgi:hypothetical protein